VLKKLNKTYLKPAIIITLLIVAIATTATSVALLSTSQALPSSGKINTSANTGVYSDNACQNTLTTINWGNLTAGAHVHSTIYIKNTDSSHSIALNMTASNWNPSTANGNLTLSWNQENTHINPGQSVEATLTLAVSPYIVEITNFSVQISINGTSTT
jgi:hypothetical protein